MRLIDIQEAFRAAVYEDDETLAGFIHGPGRVSASAALAVYRNNTRQCLIAVLQQTFPVCVQLLGEDCFRQLAASHLNRYPSLGADVETYGENFATTVRAQLESTEHLTSAPYLADLASVEYLLHHSYFAANRRRFDFDAFAQVPPSQRARVRLILAPDIAGFRAQWPVASLWRMHQPGQSIETMEIRQQPEYLIIARECYRPQLHPVNETDNDMLARITAGADFEAILTQVNHAQETLQAFLKNGWIEGFHV